MTEPAPRIWLRLLWTEAPPVPRHIVVASRHEPFAGAEEFCPVAERDAIAAERDALRAEVARLTMILEAMRSFEAGEPSQPPRTGRKPAALSEPPA